jgi:hypothetical protein
VVRRRAAPKLNAHLASIATRFETIYATYHALRAGLLLPCVAAGQTILQASA